MFLQVGRRDLFYGCVLLLIACGVWAIVLQNAGVIPTSVSIRGSVDVSGSVNVDNTVDVSGSVDVPNGVNVNLKWINGKREFYDWGGNGNYVRIPVYAGY